MISNVCRVHLSQEACLPLYVVSCIVHSLDIFVLIYRGKIARWKGQQFRSRLDHRSMRIVDICIITFRPISVIKTRNLIRLQAESSVSVVFPRNLTNN